MQAGGTHAVLILHSCELHMMPDLNQWLLGVLNNLINVEHEGYAAFLRPVNGSVRRTKNIYWEQVLLE
jgi:hypothetical protein